MYLMDFTITWTLAAILSAMATLQTVYVFIYRRFLAMPGDFLGLPREPNSESQNQQFETAPDKFPQTAIVLCLRGADPSLTGCLRGIAAQDYPNFKLHVVVDDLNDPALATVKQFFHDSPGPEIYVIGQRFDTCSLKCSAILEAISAVPDPVEIIALIDADTTPDADWLSDLVAPFADPTVGATTGIRWFTPTTPGLGSYVRAIWNGAAIVQMAIYNIGWGGTLAFRKSALEECELTQKWQHAFCEDTMVADVMQQNGLRLVRVPNLILDNTESTSVRDAFSWVARQLLTVRLYHKKWPLVAIHGLTTLVSCAIVPLALIGLLVFRQYSAFLVLLMFFVGQQLVNVALLELIKSGVLKSLATRKGTEGRSSSGVNWGYHLAATLLAQFVHPAACIVAHFSRRVRWRGIEYKISKNKIGMTRYLPYRDVVEVDTQPDDESIG